MEHKKPLISIIIPAYNEENYLPRTLESIKSQTFKDYEITVAVSPKTTDKTREIALSMGTRVIEGGRVGRARNNGAKTAREESELLVFMDADVRAPTNDFLEKAIGEFVERNLAIATCFVTFDSSGLEGILARILFGFYRYFELLTEKFWAFPIGGFMIIKPAVFDIRGHKNCWGFDEDISFAEEVDFGQRAMNAGKKYGIIRQTIIASDRRFKNKGAWKMLGEYLYRGIGLLFGYEYRYSKGTKNYFD